jgi:hypothetical protein
VTTGLRYRLLLNWRLSYRALPQWAVLNRSLLSLGLLKLGLVRLRALGGNLFSPGNRAVRRAAADDIRFYNDVGWTADQHKMFNMIPAHKDKTTSAVDPCSLHDRQSWLSTPRRPADGIAFRSFSQQPGYDGQDKDNDNKGDDKLRRQRTLAEC